MYGPLELPPSLYCSAVKNVELAIVKLQKDGTLIATTSGDKPFVRLSHSVD
jgi:hypothetical protein